jgi:hypothetical protein
MAKGTRIRSFRLSDSQMALLLDWGRRHLGTTNFSTIVRHLIQNAIDEGDK